MGRDTTELRAATWAIGGPLPAALIVGLMTNLWAIAWCLQLAGGIGYLVGARIRVKRRAAGRPLVTNVSSAPVR